MTETSPDTGHGHVIAFLAAHQQVERVCMAAFGALGFCAFVLPVVLILARMGDAGHKLPFLLAPSMYPADMAARVLVAFGPSVLGMSLLYGFLRRNVTRPVARLREVASAAH